MQNKKLIQIIREQQEEIKNLNEEIIKLKYEIIKLKEQEKEKQMTIFDIGDE